MARKEGRDYFIPQSDYRRRPSRFATIKGRAEFTAEKLRRLPDLMQPYLQDGNSNYRYFLMRLVKLYDAGVVKASERLIHSQNVAAERNVAILLKTGELVNHFKDDSKHTVRILDLFAAYALTGKGFDNGKSFDKDVELQAAYLNEMEKACPPWKEFSAWKNGILGRN